MADRAFGARYDRLTKIISGGVVVVAVAVVIAAMRAGVGAVFAALVSAVVIGLSFALSPRGYEISRGVFRVKRLIGDVVFPLDRLRFVRYATPADLCGGVRLWGSGGCSVITGGFGRRHSGGPGGM